MSGRTSLLLRIGVAFAFAYPAISAFVTPLAWVGFLPAFARDLAGSGNERILLHLFGAIELALALWLLSGKRVFIPSAASALILGAVVSLNVNQMDVVFRDLPILLMALILALESRPRASARSGTMGA